MPDVGEVRYKAVVDNSGVDQQIDETEKKLNKIGDAADKTSERVQKSAEKSGSTIKKATNDTTQGFKNSTDETKKFSDALGKVPDAPVKDVGAAVKGLGTAIKDLGVAVRINVIDPIKSVGVAAKEYIGAGIKTHIVDPLKEVGAVVKTKVVDPIKDVGAAVKEHVGEAVKKHVVDPIKSVGETVKTNIVDPIKEVGTAVKTNVGETVKKYVVNPLKTVGEAVDKHIGTPLKNIGGAVKNVGVALKNLGSALKNNAGNSIENLNAKLKASKDALKGVDEALKKMPHSFGLLKEKLSLTKDEVNATKDKLKALKEAQEEAKKAFKSGEISSDDYRAIKRETLETQAGLKELKHEVKDAYKQLATSNAAVAGISKVGGALGKISIATIKGIGKAFIGLTSAAGAGMAAVAKMGIDYNAQMQSYETAFRTMLGDAEKATALTDKLKTLAAKTPLAMTDLADASKTLLAFGSSAEELPDQLKRLGDVAQGDAQALGTMATAFGRVQSNGYASLEEINMMIDQGFNPLQIIADKTGESMADVRKRVSEGKVSFEELNEALQTATDSGGQFYNAMENQSKTFEGQISTLKDNVSALAGILTEDLFAGLAENALPKVNEWVNQLTDAAEKEGTAGAIETAGVILTEAVTELLNGAPKFIETATSLVGSFLGSIKDNGPKIMDGALDVIMTLIDGFISMVPELIETAGVLITALINGLADRAPQILGMAVKLVVVLAEGLVKSVPKIIAAALKLIDSFRGAFLKIDWGKIGLDVVDGIINGLASAAHRLWEAASNLASGALKGIKNAFKSNSPSKEAIKIAQTVPQGMVKAWDEDSLAASAAKDLGERAIAGLTADVNYHVPDVGKYAKSLTADFSGSYRAGAEIIVPLSVSGREIARASAWWTGEQLSWEEM